jgi:hypothetical protein
MAASIRATLQQETSPDEVVLPHSVLPSLPDQQVPWPASAPISHVCRCIVAAPCMIPAPACHACLYVCDAAGSGLCTP